VSPTIEVNNFELQPPLVSFVEQNQFGRRPMQNPHLHLRNFLAKYDTNKLNGVFIALHILPKKIENRAIDWLLNEEPNSITI